MSKDKEEPVVAERVVASVARTGRGGRFSAPRKVQALLRLLRGEDLELLSRDLGVIASTLSLWRDEFLAAGQLALKGKTGFVVEPHRVAGFPAHLRRTHYCRVRLSKGDYLMTAA
jgi:hypothetical protein